MQSDKEMLVRLLREHIDNEWRACLSDVDYDVLARHLIANNVVVKKFKTNGDRIRNMTDEELAWELMRWCMYAIKAERGETDATLNTASNILEFLRK